MSITCHCFPLYKIKGYCVVDYIFTILLFFSGMSLFSSFFLLLIMGLNISPPTSKSKLGMYMRERKREGEIGRERGGGEWWTEESGGEGRKVNERGERGERGGEGRREEERKGGWRGCERV